MREHYLEKKIVCSFVTESGDQCGHTFELEIENYTESELFKYFVAGSNDKHRDRIFHYFKNLRMILAHYNSHRVVIEGNFQCSYPNW